MHSARGQGPEGLRLINKKDDLLQASQDQTVKKRYTIAHSGNLTQRDMLTKNRGDNTDLLGGKDFKVPDQSTINFPPSEAEGGSKFAGRGDQERSSSPEHG